MSNLTQPATSYPLEGGAIRNPLRMVQLCEALDKIKKYEVAQDYAIARANSLNKEELILREEYFDESSNKISIKTITLLF